MTPPTSEEHTIFISSIPESAAIWYGSSDGTTLVFQCAAAENSGALEIGDKHIYVSKKDRILSSKREVCGLRIRIKRSRSMGDEAVAKLGLSKGKIGDLCFCPPSEAGDMSSAIPASLEADVILEDHLFDCLMTTLHSARKVEWIRLDIDGKGRLRYGWEPDGSRVEWKLGSEVDPNYIDVASIALGIELFSI